MRKRLAVTVAVAMVLSMLMPFLPGGAALASGSAADGAVVRRALIIGNANYAYSSLTGPVYDAMHMKALFQQMDFGSSGGEQGKMDDGNIVLKDDQTRGQILKDIVSAFPTTGAGQVNEDDVSYFYYSGHGSVLDGEAQIVGVDMNMVSLTDLKAALDPIPGTKVIILDSCFSGGFVDKVNAAADKAKGSAGKGSVIVLPGHPNPDPARDKVATPRASGLTKIKPGTADGSLFPSALKQQPPQSDESLAAQFNKSVSSVFSKTTKYLNGGKYVALTASTQNEYSYEFGFNTLYGPNFIMNGKDTAEPGTADSGEFTGMLIAAAGKVTYTPMYGETGLLADYSGDLKLTADELYHYLRGAVIGSDIALYPSAGDYQADHSLLDPDQAVLFSHAAPEANAPRVRLDGPSGIPADITTGKAGTGMDIGDTSIKIDLNLAGIPDDYKKQLVIYKFPKTTDGTAANGSLGENAVKTFELASSATDVTWDGKDDTAENNPVADGTYRVMLECGEGRVQPGDPAIVYPGITLVLDRGVSDFDSANDISEDKPGGLASTDGGNTYTYSGTISIAHDGDTVKEWFTAPETGAMNVYANATKLNAGLYAECRLLDAEGNVVDYSSSAMYKQLLFMPFYVEKGKEYRLVFDIYDNQDKSGDTGNFSFSLRLNKTIGISSNGDGDVNQVTGAAKQSYEAWYVRPGAGGDYKIQSSGADDTAAILVDRNQVEAIATNDDFNDRQFLISTPLVKDAGYLIVAYDYNVADKTAVGFKFKVDAPGALDNKFSTVGVPAITGNFSGEVTDANGDGATSYFKITVNSTPEKWTFATLESDDGPGFSMDNDPSLLLMDTSYNLVASNDDYNGDMGAEFSAVLKQGTYILACYGWGAVDSYDFVLKASRQALASSPYVVTMPKAVYMDDSALTLDRYGTVSGWGLNMYGEAGIGTMAPSQSPAAVILPGSGKAVNVWGGDDVGFARLSDGEYCWWGMSFGPIDMGGNDDNEPFTSAPVLLGCLKGMDIADIRYGSGDYALVRTYTGELYLLDIYGDGIAPVKLPGEGSHSVAETAVTDYSYFALCADGKLFSWGENDFGECGTGDAGSVKNPTLVSFGSGVTIRHVAAGWDHVLALDSDGDVYSWGYNVHGELGQGDLFTYGKGSVSGHTKSGKPMKIDRSEFAGNAVTSVFAGGNHSICVDSAGNVYGWGINTYGEFGLENTDKLPAPAKIPFYSAFGKDANGHDVLMTMSAGMMAVFAQDHSSNVYGYGSGLDGQVFRDPSLGPAPDDGTPVKLMTLPGAVATHSTLLRSLHIDAGTIVYDSSTNPKKITVTIPAGDDKSVSICTILSEPEDWEAVSTVTVGGHQLTSNQIAVANPGGSAAASITVSHPGSSNTTTYTLTVLRSKSSNANLSGIGLTPGASLSPAFSKSKTSYTVTIPETMGSVAVSPRADGFGANYTIDNGWYDDSKTYSPPAGGSLPCTVKVTAQALNTKTYNLTIKRPYMLSSLSAAPVYSGYPSLSPGGTDSMKISFYLTYAAAVKIEVQKGSDWYTLASIPASGVKAGYNTWAWKGIVNGSYLSKGTYTIRVTPTYNGAACMPRTMMVKILGKPSAYFTRFSATTLRANGANRLAFSVRWTVLSDVTVDIINGSGKSVCTLWSAAGQAPGTKALYWYGKASGGSLVPAGTYKMRIVAGGTTTYKTIKVTR